MINFRLNIYISLEEKLFTEIIVEYFTGIASIPHEQLMYRLLIRWSIIFDDTESKL